MLARSAFPGAAFRIALFAILTVSCLWSTSLRAESANSYFKAGESAEAREDYDAAFDNYQKAYAKSPKDLRFRTALARVRVTDSSVHLTKGRKLLNAGDEQAALVEFLRAAEIDPGNEAAQQEIAGVRQKHGEVETQAEAGLPEEAGRGELNSMGAPVELKPLSNEPLTLHMTEDAKVIYQAVGKAAGVNILFDPDFTSKRIQVDLNNVSLLDALRIVGTISNTFWRPVTASTIFVAQNSTAKRRDLDDQAVQTFYLANAWQQNDVTDVQTAIRNVMQNVKVYAVASQNAIVVRGTPDELLLAQKLVDDLDKPRAEVVVDIAILEVSRNWERTLGISWPSSVGVALTPPTSSSSSSTTTTGTTGTTGTTSTGTTPTLYDLSHLKATNFAVTIGSAQANLLLTDSNTKILDNPRIRSTDGQKATMKIGTRIPIATGSYQTGAATAMVSSLVNTQFQYIDVGVNIEMTPTIHFDHDVTLKIKIEDSSEDGNVTISGVTEPIIAQKTSEQVIRLREGEASVLSGMLDKTDTVSWNGIPGLSSIPVLKYLFGSKDHTIQDDEIVFLVVPHLVRTETLNRVNLRAIDTGAGTSIDLRHVPQEGSGTSPNTGPAANPGSISAPGAAPASHGPAPARPNVGVVPGQSAMGAAPAALRQLSASAEANGETAAAAVGGHPPSPAAQPGPPDQFNRPRSAGPSLMFSPLSGPVAAGSTFQLPVVLTGGTDIASVPMQIQYDPDKLSLVNVGPGEFLSRDGQAAPPVHRDERGLISINASRPPGTAGVNGGGIVYILSFQAKVAGESIVAMTRAATVNSAQQQTPVQGARISIQVK
jgi:general secretion pathway protein D